MAFEKRNRDFVSKLFGMLPEITHEQFSDKNSTFEVRDIAEIFTCPEIDGQSIKLYYILGKQSWWSEGALIVSREAYSEIKREKGKGIGHYRRSKKEISRLLMPELVWYRSLLTDGLNHNFIKEKMRNTLSPTKEK